MALSNNDVGKIRDYLLGRLSEEEQEKIEERLMVEDDFFEELEISKGELIEEYRAGDLSQNDQEWFQRHYLATPDGKRHHTFSLALNSIERPPIPIPAPKPPLLERLRSLFTTRQAWPIATSAALVLMAGVTLLIYVTRTPSYEYVELTNNVADRSPTANQYQKVNLSPDAGGLRISLKLPEATTPGAKYRAEFDNRTDVETIMPASQDTNSVVVEIPSQKLPAGLYALRLYEIKADGTEQRVRGEYRFEIR